MLGKRRPFSQWSQVATETPNSAAARLIGTLRCSRQERKRLASNTPAEGKISEAVEWTVFGITILNPLLNGLSLFSQAFNQLVGLEKFHPSGLG